MSERTERTNSIAYLFGFLFFGLIIAAGAAAVIGTFVDVLRLMLRLG
jgi:hypothetical protein